MSEKPERTFTQSEVDVMMEKHRKGLQQKIALQELRIEHLQDQIRQLSKPEYNPVAKILLAALEKEPAHV